MTKLFGFLKIWKWRIFHRKKKSKGIVSDLDDNTLKELATALKEVEAPLAGKKPLDPRNISPSVYPSRNMLLITSESDMKLRPVRVNDDHSLTYKKKKILIKPDRPAHIFDINIHDLMPTRKQRLFCKLFGVPQFQTFRTFTTQEEGEMTHDPHLDHLGDDMKMRFEKMLMLVGKFAEADAGAVLYEGIKGPKKWWDYIPYIVICLIVAFFLFAFQVQPNL